MVVLKHITEILPLAFTGRTEKQPHPRLTPLLELLLCQAGQDSQTNNNGLKAPQSLNFSGEPTSCSNPISCSQQPMWALLCMFSYVYASFSIWTGFSNTTSLLLHMTAAASFPCTQNSVQSQNKCDLEAVQGQETTSQHSKQLSAVAKILVLRSAFCLLCDTKHINRKEKKWHLREMKQEWYTCFRSSDGVRQGSLPLINSSQMARYCF